MKIKELGPGKGGPSLAPPLDPPLGQDRVGTFDGVSSNFPDMIPHGLKCARSPVDFWQIWQNLIL